MPQSPPRKPFNVVPLDVAQRHSSLSPAPTATSRWSSLTQMALFSVSTESSCAADLSVHGAGSRLVLRKDADGKSGLISRKAERSFADQMLAAQFTRCQSPPSFSLPKRSPPSSTRCPVPTAPFPRLLPPPAYRRSGSRATLQPLPRRWNRRVELGSEAHAPLRLLRTLGASRRAFLDLMIGVRE